MRQLAVDKVQVEIRSLLIFISKLTSQSIFSPPIGMIHVREPDYLVVLIAQSMIESGLSAHNLKL